MTVTEYEKLADVFLGGARQAHVQECTRSRGALIRFDPRTDLYGILAPGGVILTCFKPVPCSTVPAAQLAAVKLVGKCHDKRTNLDYYRSECRK